MRSPDTLAAIKSAILLAPEAVQNGTTADKEIYLNTPISQDPKVYVYIPVPRDDFVRTLATHNLFAKLTTDFLKMIELSEFIEVQHPSFQIQLDVLVVDGVLKTDAINAINDLGKSEVLKSPGDSFGFGLVTFGEVEEAMAS